MGALLTYAYDSENNLVHIDDVQKGCKCNCHCPKCNAPLDAKNGGEIREHHFAHAHGHICEGAEETVVHLLAKEIIEEAGGIMLPESNDASKPSGFVKLTNIEKEKWDETYNIRPDVEGVMSDGRRLIIECMVTHKVADKKYNIIIENNLLCVEIDIKYFRPDKKELREYITEESGGRKWIVKRNKNEESDISFRYSKNPRFDKVKEMLKKAFYDNKLAIKYLDESNFDYRKDISINYLHKFGYDICEENTMYKGIKTDLLLYRSKKDDKGYISINFRGRNRNFRQRIPRDLRVIDIILRDESDEMLQQYFSDGILFNHGYRMTFIGNWKNKNTN